tara:strand:- start:293 stop:1912 length:1620 start_codon:yes stop_codon:yes gene_type:complete
MSLSQVLLESRKDDFLRMFRNKFSDEQLKKVFSLSRQLAPNQKFLTFLGNVIPTENFDESLSKAEKVVEKFIKYQQALQQRDINQFKSLEEIITAINNHENKVRRTVKSVDGANIVYEDDRFTVVTPQTHKASCYYGAGTKWCTASMNGSSHFDNYNVDGKLFYILDKKAKSNDKYYKVALLQKYDGDKTFYDAPDKSFTSGWILGTPEYDEIQNAINKYVNDNFQREINIFKDKEAARLERERLRKVAERRRVAQLRAEADERKEEDSWNLENEPDQEGLYANAVFEIMVDNYNVSVDEEEGESIYDLVPSQYSHYDLPTFEWVGDDDTGITFAVGTWDEVWQAAKEYMEGLWDDQGADGWSNSFIESHIDEQEVREYFYDMFEDDVNNNYESYFDTDDLPLSDEQESQVAKLKEEAEELDEITKNVDDIYNEDEVELAEDRWNEIDDEITDIESDPEGEPTEEQIEDMTNSRVDDAMYDMMGSMADYGLDISDYVDKDALFESAIDSDGVGNSLGSYDGDDNEVMIGDTWYHVFRTE